MSTCLAFVCTTRTAYRSDALLVAFEAPDWKRYGHSTGPNDGSKKSITTGLNHDNNVDFDRVTGHLQSCGPAHGRGAYCVTRDNNTHTDMHTHTLTQIYNAHTPAHTYTMHAHTEAHIHMLHTHTHTHWFIYMPSHTRYAHTHTHTHRQTHMRAHKHTHRGTQKVTHIHFARTEAQTATHIYTPCT